MLLKRVVIFIGAFLIMIVLDAMFFSGIFSQIPGSVPSNTFLSLTLALWLFLLLPALVAYYVSFKLLLKNHPLPERRARVLVIVLGVVSIGILLFVASQTLLKTKWAPYSLETVSNEQLEQLSRGKEDIVLEKQIGDSIYRLRRDGSQSENLALYKIDKNTQKEEIVDVPLLFRSPAGNGVWDFWYVAESRDLYTLEGDVSKSNIFLYPYHDNKKVLAPTDSTSINLNTKILFYLQSTNRLLLETTGYPSGQGKIWSVDKNGAVKNIQEYSFECNNEKSLPLLVGFDGNLLVLIDCKLSQANRKLIRSIYTLNPENDAKDILYIDPNIAFEFDSAYIDEAKQVVVGKVDGKKFILDSVKKELIQVP